MKIVFLFFFLLGAVHSVKGQLKFLLEDFEGFADHPGDLKQNGVFTFGNTTAAIDNKITTRQSYSGERCLKLTQSGVLSYGGWGKGIGLNIELDVTKDYLNFYAYHTGNSENIVRVELQEDDNGNNIFEKEIDDTWQFKYKPKTCNSWELVTLPLSTFMDMNNGGDGLFNVSYKKGKLCAFVITFENAGQLTGSESCFFDFFCFSKGQLRTGERLFDAPSADSADFCGLGAWSKEGNTANFSDIASSFENNFKMSCEKKLGVVHLFQPFSVHGGDAQHLYPSVERIDKIIKNGYIPLITLEDHFVNAKPNTKQPNLYSIVEGHFDAFFSNWANQIKKVDGIVLLRILHEFNGDWYPWCIANNDNDPQLVVKAFRHIHGIFKKQEVANVRFIWCPNSMSIPQESWNYIMDAYPGNEYVDYVGLDIYNGAGKDMPVWRSFRKEGMENYFILTQQLPDKPLLVCEAASRERKGTESQTAQSKPEWIRDMSEALATDMSRIKLLTWFNEKESFKVNSSPASQKAFLDFVMKNNYFKSGTREIYSIFK